MDKRITWNVSYMKMLTGLAIFMLAVAFLVPGAAHGATVKSLKVENNSTVVKALDSKGKVVWKYKSKASGETQIGPLSAKINGSYVYIIDRHTYTSAKAKLLKLKKNSGKVVKSKAIKNFAVGNMLITKSYIYTQGFDSSYLFKIDKKKLNVVWKKNTSKVNGACAYAYKISGNKLTVFYELGSNGGTTATFNAKTGKLISVR